MANLHIIANSKVFLKELNIWLLPGEEVFVSDEYATIKSLVEARDQQKVTVQRTSRYKPMVQYKHKPRIPAIPQALRGAKPPPRTTPIAERVPRGEEVRVPPGPQKSPQSDLKVKAAQLRKMIQEFKQAEKDLSSQRSEIAKLEEAFKSRLDRLEAAVSQKGPSAEDIAAIVAAKLQDTVARVAPQVVMEGSSSAPSSEAEISISEPVYIPKDLGQADEASVRVHVPEGDADHSGEDVARALSKLKKKTSKKKSKKKTSKKKASTKKGD